MHVGAGFKPAPRATVVPGLYRCPASINAQRTASTPPFPASASRVNGRAGKRDALWQRGYYEPVIRNEKALDRIRNCIANNPARWADDPDNISGAASAE